MRWLVLLVFTSVLAGEVNDFVQGKLVKHVLDPATHWTVTALGVYIEKVGLQGVGAWLATQAKNVGLAGVSIYLSKTTTTTRMVSYRRPRAPLSLLQALLVTSLPPGRWLIRLHPSSGTYLGPAMRSLRGLDWRRLCCSQSLSCTWTIGLVSSAVLRPVLAWSLETSLRWR